MTGVLATSADGYGKWTASVRVHQSTTVADAETVRDAAKVARAAIKAELFERGDCNSSHRVRVRVIEESGRAVAKAHLHDGDWVMGLDFEEV